MSTDNSQQSIGIIGYGGFGQLLASLLSSYSTVKVYDHDSGNKAKASKNVQFVTFDEAAKCQTIFIATGLEGIRPVCEKLKSIVNKDSLVADVCSVKVLPAQIMQEVLGGKCQLLATHPLFGPQTVKKSEDAKSQKMMWHELSDGCFDSVRHIFEKKLGIEIVEMQPEAHDKEMAWVHGLTFFVGRALLNMQPPNATLGTNYYQKLIDLWGVESQHSMELFMTIQKGNPFTDDIRLEFMKVLQGLEETIKEER